MTTDQILTHQSRTAALRAEFHREWSQRTDLDAYTPGQQHRLMVDAWREKLSQQHEIAGADKMSVHWPPSYRGRIPVKVRMACDLGPDMWGILGRGTPRHWVKNNDELLVKVNQHGALSVVTPYGDLGVKPLECEIIEWREKLSHQHER